MAFDPQWLLYAVLFILAVVLVVRYGKALLLVGALLALVAVAWAWGEQATATRQVATAATVSAAGQTAGSVTATVLATLLVVVLLAAGGAVVYLWLRMKALERQDFAGRGAAGGGRRGRVSVAAHEGVGTPGVRSAARQPVGRGAQRALGAGRT